MSNEKINLSRRVRCGIPLWEKTRNKLLTAITSHFASQNESTQPHQEISHEPTQTINSEAHDYQIEVPVVEIVPVTEEVAELPDPESTLSVALESEAKPEIALELETETKPEIDTESRSEIEPEVETEAKPEVELELETENMPALEGPSELELPLETTLEPVSTLETPNISQVPVTPPIADMQIAEPWSKELLERYATLPLPPFYDTVVQQEKVASEIRRQNILLQNTQQHAITSANTLTGLKEQLFNLDTDLSGIKDSIQEMRGFLQEKLESELDDDNEEPLCELNEEENDYSSSHSTAFSRHNPNQDKRLIDLLQRVEERLSATASPEGCLMDALDALFQLLQVTEKMASDVMSLVPFTTGFLKSSKPNWRIQLEKILESHLEGITIVRNKLINALSDLGITTIDVVPGDLFSPELHRAVERFPNEEHAGQVAQLIRYGYMKENTPLRYASVAVFC